MSQSIRHRPLKYPAFWPLKVLDHFNHIWDDEMDIVDDEDDDDGDESVGSERLIVKAKEGARY